MEKSLFNSSIRPILIDFLKSVVSSEDIYSISSTASNGKIKPESIEGKQRIIIYLDQYLNH